MPRCGDCQHKAWDLFCERGGGSKPSPPTIIPAPPAPNVGQMSREALQAQLDLNPALTRQAVDLQGQYGLPLAQQQLQVQQQLAPQYRQLLEQQFPQIGTLATQTQQGLQNPTGLNAQQQAATDAIRQRQRDELSRSIAQNANIGGTLYGGRTQQRLDRGQADLSNQYAMQDIGLQSQQRAQTMQELATLFQLAGFNVQQPQVPQFGQSAAPSSDALLSALVQNQGNFGVIPGQSGGGGFGDFFNPRKLWTFGI